MRRDNYDFSILRAISKLSIWQDELMYSITILHKREYVGTITMHRSGGYRTSGECIDGDPEYFYRSAIVAWKTIE